MAGLCEGGNEPPGSLKALLKRFNSYSRSGCELSAFDVENCTVRLFSPDSRRQCAPGSGVSIKLRQGVFRYPQISLNPEDEEDEHPRNVGGSPTYDLAGSPRKFRIIDNLSLLPT
ncbi:hypothetical protein ANN_13200 [Periplaneta americana]|uniref:Uncharacterized protein n=1 Tax=Periplaneta americana TaxID=6978 RepID=A0ABQ8TJ87_PERAM|nr:hypothetical protein ANN_13200 [Periplaneta americana]